MIKQAVTMNDIEIVDAVLKSWACPGARTELNPAASLEEILAVQAELGRRFPDDFVALYRHADGGRAVGGNIGLYLSPYEALLDAAALDSLARTSAG